MFTALPPLICAQRSGELQMKGDVHKDRSEEFGLRSQLLFIICALESLEI